MTQQPICGTKRDCGMLELIEIRPCCDKLASLDSLGHVLWFSPCLGVWDGPLPVEELSITDMTEIRGEVRETVHDLRERMRLRRVSRDHWRYGVRWHGVPAVRHCAPEWVDDRAIILGGASPLMPPPTTWQQLWADIRERAQLLLWTPEGRVRYRTAWGEHTAHPAELPREIWQSLPPGFARLIRERL